MDPHWSSRQTFELYVYDYLVKRNMHHTAEVFRNEANLHLDNAPALRDAVDVPEGFLREWWSVHGDFDYFRQMHDKPGLFGGRQGFNAFQGVGSSMNVEPMYQLPNKFTPPVQALNMGSNFMPSRGTGQWPVFSLPSAHQEVRGQLPQFRFPFSRQEACGELQQLSSALQDVVMTPVEKTTEVSNFNSPEAKSEFSEETDPLIESLLKSFWLYEDGEPNLFDKPTLGESSRNGENLVERGDGNTGMNAIAGSAPALEEDDNRSDTSDCSSSFQLVFTPADASTDPQLESHGEP